MGNSISRASATTGRQAPRATTATGTLPQASTCIENTEARLPSSVAPVLSITIQRPGLLDALRGPREIPDGMVSIVTPHDGTATLSTELATSLSARYHAAFTNGMAETQERRIVETVDVPRGVWGVLFSALTGVHMTTLANAEQALSVLTLLDYIDPQQSFLTQSGNAAMRTLANHAVASLPALCERSSIHLETVATAFTWATRFDDTRASQSLLRSLTEYVSRLPDVIDQLDKRALLTILASSQLTASAECALLWAWADDTDDPTLTDILDGSHTLQPDAQTLAAPSSAREIGSIPTRHGGVKRVFTDVAGDVMRVVTREGDIYGFDAQGHRRQYDAPLAHVADYIAQGDTQVVHGTSLMPRGEPLTAVIMRPGAEPFCICNDRLRAVALDATHLAEGYDTGVIRLRDLATNAMVGDGYRSLDTCVDTISLGKHFVCGVSTNEHMRVWDRNTGACLLSLRGVAGHCVRDDGIIVNTRDGMMTVYARWENRLLQVHSFASPVYESGIVSDGVHVMGARDETLGDHVVDTFDLQSGEQVNALHAMGGSRIVMLQRCDEGLALSDDRGHIWLCR